MNHHKQENSRISNKKNTCREMQNGQSKGSGQGQEQGMRRDPGMGKNKQKSLSNL